MTTEQMNAVVFKDQAGEYYVLPQAALERSRVSAEHTVAVERLFAEAEADDVSGHSFALGVLVSAVMYQNDQPLRWVLQRAVANFES